MTNPETASFSQFAAILGCSPSWVTQLRQADRLVLTEDNKRVRVAESIARIKATEDPAKGAVSARHAQSREQAATHAAAGSRSAPVSPDVPHVPQAGKPSADRDPAVMGYQQARAVRERYAAMQAKLDYEIATGKLLDADQVAGAIANAGTALRTRLENLPDALAPRLAVISDEKSIRLRLREEIEHALDELARQFSSIGKAA